MSRQAPNSFLPHSSRRARLEAAPPEGGASASEGAVSCRAAGGASRPGEPPLPSRSHPHFLPPIAVILRLFTNIFSIFLSRPIRFVVSSFRRPLAPRPAPPSRLSSLVLLPSYFFLLTFSFARSASLSLVTRHSSLLTFPFPPPRPRRILLPLTAFHRKEPP